MPNRNKLDSKTDFRTKYKSLEAFRRIKKNAIWRHNKNGA